MATRWYTDPTNAPDVSPAYDDGWDETAEALRRKLSITSDGIGTIANSDTDSIAAPAYYLLWQFVSEPLDAISATFPVCKATFQCRKSNAKQGSTLHIKFRKCDSDGSNPTTIASVTDDTEFDNDWYVNRFYGAANLADQALSQDDRLVIEVGFYSSYTKAGGYTGYVVARIGSATDLPEDDIEEDGFNTWIETGDTFTEASVSGWTGKVSGVDSTDISKIMGVAIADIARVGGV